MDRSPSRTDAQDLLEELIALIKSSNPGWDGELTDRTSLIKSGQLDSLGLFNLATFVEGQIGHRIDLTAFDLAKEWDTVNDILTFISNQRSSG